ncbi:MAG: hypothetical protein HY646_18845 [Acidobacteria bacterium]|nr:hypothetical protein [Acidobacteriota bacterium]
MSAVHCQGKKNVVCLLPGDGAMSLIRDARFLENADNVGTTPFWLQHQQDPEACMAELAAPVLGAAQAAGKRTHLWIQGFKVPAGREFEITRAVTSAAKLGPDVLAIWGFDGCACMSALSCERPEVAWQSFLAGLRQISESS